MKKVTIIFLLIILFLNGFPGILPYVSSEEPSGNILYVGGTGPGNYSTIQDAINASTDGGTVFVYSGTYYENINISRSIFLIGEDKNTTIIDGKNGFGMAVYIYADGVNISGFTLQNSGSIETTGYYWESGIFVISSFNTITGNIIRENPNGITLWADENTITSNTITNNYDFFSTRYFGFGISVYSSSNHTITDNVIMNNRNGISLSSSLNNVIKNNTFSSEGIIIGGSSVNHWNTHIIENNFANGKPIYYYKDDQDGVTVPAVAGQVILANCQNFILQNLTIENIDTGIQLGFSNNNYIENNLITNNTGYGINLYESHNNMMKSNNISNNYYNSIELSNSSNNNISNNEITDSNRYGILLYGSSHNSIYDNYITNNTGIFLSSKSADNIIFGNNIIKTSDGIHLSGSSNNTITENTISKSKHDAIGLTSSSIGFSDYSSDYNVVTNNNITQNNKGIKIFYSSNNVISANKIKQNNRSVDIHGSSGNILRSNTITDNPYGFLLYESTGHTISGNTFSSGGIVIKGDLERDWNSHDISNNTVNDKQIRYYKNMSDVVVPSDTAQVILINCQNFTIQNLKLLDVYMGIRLLNSTHNTIKGNSVQNSTQGI